MKTLTISLLAALTLVLSTVTLADTHAEKSIKHKVVDDIVTFDRALEVFEETTVELHTKTTLDETELNDIHMITYSLEKAVAYFVENSKDEQRVNAEKMAEVVELVHIASENNRKTQAKLYLEAYFQFSSEFYFNLKR